MKSFGWVSGLFLKAYHTSGFAASASTDLSATDIPSWFCYETNSGTSDCAHGDRSKWVAYSGSDDAYDVLDKATMLYNTGPGTSTHPMWCHAMVVRLENDSFAKGTGYGYPLIIKEHTEQQGDGYLPFRTYIWKVGTGASAYCFAYSEKDWMLSK